jgi:hypothetical protein
LIDDGQLIDLKDLFESCASLYELTIMPTLSLNREADQRLKRVLSCSYGRALRMSFRLLGLEAQSFSELLAASPTIFACFDLAFDPPLFPFIEPDDFTLDWTQLYPPGRFRRALETARKLGAAQENNMLDYRRALRRQSGLKVGNVDTIDLPKHERAILAQVMASAQLRHLEISRPDYKRAIKRLAEYVGKVSLTSLVVWYAKESGRLRRERHCGFFTDLVLNADITDDDRRVLNPPIQLENDDTSIWTAGIGYAFLYLYVSGLNFPLFDLFFGKDKIPHLPHDDYGVLKTFEQVMNAHYGLDISNLIPSS